jgi:ribosomal protein L16 Arg81 hydroxylase
MDARKMKKKIKARAIEYYQYNTDDNLRYELAIHILDKDPGEITDAAMQRARKVIRQLLESSS